MRYSKFNKITYCIEIIDAVKSEVIKENHHSIVYSEVRFSILIPSRPMIYYLIYINKLR